MKQLSAFFFAAVLSTPGVAQTPTWSDDVACIIYSHCATCHHDGGAGHFSLMDYTDAVQNASDMAYVTQQRIMPPWPPDPTYRTLAHERVLSQDEIDIIAAWVNGGAPEGIPGNAPPPPVFTSAWDIAQPDITAVMDEYAIPTSSDDIYRSFVLPINNPTDSYIKRFEVVPGNREVVHHVLVYQDTTGQGQVLDALDPAPGYDSFGGVGVEDAKLVGLWVPGASTYTTPQGMGIKLLAGADLIIQVHYPQGSNGEVDSTRINLELDPSPFIRNMAIDPILEHFFTLTDGPLVIPADQVKTFHNQYTIPIPATITAIGPHGHLLCQQMKSFAVTPTNDTIPLIDIPEWDFHWQGLYEFRKPIHLPSGTVLHGEATYDNTTNNPENPNDPPQLVTLGEATTDEMMLFYFGWTYGFPVDTNIVVDNSLHPAHHDNCVFDFNIGVGEVLVGEAVSVWPNPAHDQLQVKLVSGAGELRLFDALGREVLRQRVSVGDMVDVGNLQRGAYVAEVRDLKGTVRYKAPLVLQ